MTRGAWLAATVVGVSLMAAPLRGRADDDRPIFSWVDAKGSLHATDRLQDVPEPYFSMYSAKLKELEMRRNRAGPMPQRAEEPPPRPPNYTSPVHVPTTQEEAAHREAWRQTMRTWRAELDNATAHLKELEERYAEKGMNPMLRLTPQVQAELQAMEPDLDAARKRVMDARNMLLEVLPKRARDEHVPPLWLM